MLRSPILPKALSSEMISNIITAMGTSVGDSFDIEKLRL